MNDRPNPCVPDPTAAEIAEAPGVLPRAGLIGVPPRAVVDVERGRTAPDEVMLRMLAGLLGVEWPEREGAP